MSFTDRRTILSKLWFFGFILFFTPALVRAQATATYTLTPNASLTPPCSPAGSFGNSVQGTSFGSTADEMRGSVYTLSSPATVYTLTAYFDNPPSNMQVITGIYSGSTDNFGSLIVASAAQPVVNGWNGFTLTTPTYLSAGTYWLSYVTSEGGYDVPVAPVGASNTGAFTSTSIVFADGMPSTMPTPGYGTNKESIYGLYCLIPTNTPTATFSPTISPTPTTTYTETNTGTINTNTPTVTNTYTSTYTVTFTMTPTYSATPNLSLTPSCGGSFLTFGDTDASESPVTALAPQMRACLYTLPSAGTVQTMSLYMPPYNVGDTAEVAIYNSTSSDAMGTLVAQSTTQTVTSGWNNFEIPSSSVTAGNYWLAYICSAPVSFELVHQTSPAAVTTLAFNTNTAYLSSWTFYANGPSYVPTYAPNWYEPIVANYCPGTLNTNTVTYTPTVANTQTATNTQTLSPTVTNSITESQTDTITVSPTVTSTDTAGNTFTVTYTQTVTESATVTNSQSFTPTPTNSLTGTVPPTNTNTSTDTASSTATNTSTATSTNTLTVSPTNTITVSSTSTATASSTSSATGSSTSTATSTNSTTASPTNTITDSPTVVVTNTASNTPSWTPTSSMTYTVSETLTSTVTGTLTIAATATSTVSQTTTATSTLSITPSATPSLSFTPTPSTANILSMFPNPIQGNNGVNLQIYFDQPHDYVSIKIYTIAFRKIFDTRVNYVSAGQFNYYVDPTTFKGGLMIANGLYYVVVTTPSNHWMTKLLVLR